MIANGCAVSGNDADGVIDHFFDAIAEYLIDGCRVVTRGGNFSMSIKGNFEGKTDSFSASRHRINVNINAGALLRRNVLSRIHIQKELSGPVRPELLEYTDWNSTERDSVLTPGGLGQIIGQNLKFDPADPEQGIFFIAEDGTASKVSVISHNTGGQLTFLVPAELAPGDYSLEVRANVSSGSLRTGTLEATLTVS